MGKVQLDMFAVRSGVRQGCSMSATLFIKMPDCVMRKVIEGRGTGIKWKRVEHLKDLDFADDIYLMSYVYRDAQLKMKRIEGYGRKVRLKR